MAEAITHRSVTVNVGSERLTIKTDLPDGDIKEIVDYIDERYTSYDRYNLEAGKKFALLALEFGQQISELRKMLHQVKVERDELNNGIKEIAALLDEGLEHPESRDSDWV
jgi:hypothetical protein